MESESKTMNDWQVITARVVSGHGVASGRNGNPRFPGGTLRMQADHLRQCGIDLSAFFLGTINVSIAPYRYRVVHPRHTIRQLKWHPTEPAEDFSFFDIRAAGPVGDPVAGLIYYPHPDTKPTHFQRPNVLELLLPHIDQVRVGAEMRLEIPRNQMLIEDPSAQR